jgi:four helix bundle protein
MNLEFRSKIQTFTDLKAWQEGHKLVLLIYKTTSDFPPAEQFGLVSQMRRAVVSITSNIAEGFARETYADKVRFYSMAHGSLTEIQNQLVIARDVGFIRENVFSECANQAIVSQKILSGLIRHSKDRRDSKF